MKKLAIIGASYLQEPLIQKAKSMGLETHVFAWKTDDIGEKSADFFYDISIVEKERILEKCREINIDGICSIASDLAIVTVNYVACHLGLIGNSLECTEISTNKHSMRKAFFEGGVASPRSFLVNSAEELNDIHLEYPAIVKPLDRSGSRGITKVYEEDQVPNAIENAKNVGFIKQALVEDFVSGEEYSVEAISWKGEHSILAVTKKYTTGEPNYVEMGHIEPALLSIEQYDSVCDFVENALSVLGIEYGASHSEIKITPQGDIKVIEIGGRMGGDFIGSHLVHLSTGYDFIKAVIQVSLGEKPGLVPHKYKKIAGVRFVFSEEDVRVYRQILEKSPHLIVESQIDEEISESILDSSERCGYYIMCADEYDEIKRYMPVI